MAASKRAGCAHPAHRVQMVFYLGDAFTARPKTKSPPAADAAYQTHSVQWCSDCGAIMTYVLEQGRPREVWRTPRLSE